MHAAPSWLVNGDVDRGNRETCADELETGRCPARRLMHDGCLAGQDVETRSGTGASADETAAGSTKAEEEGTAGEDPRTTEKARFERALDEIEKEIVELTVHIDAATSHLLRAVSEFDRRRGWEDGFLSCAHWLSWRTGMDLVTARERVRVARALDSLPLLDAAFREGKVSYSKVRAVVRIATPENEQDLTRMALDATASQMEKLARVYQNADLARDPEETRRQHRQRFLSMYEDDDGMLVVRGRLTPELGVLFRKALEAAMEALREEQGRTKADAVPAREVTSPLPPDGNTDGARARLAEPAAATGSLNIEPDPMHDSAESPPAEQTALPCGLAGTDATDASWETGEALPRCGGGQRSKAAGDNECTPGRGIPRVDDSAESCCLRADEHKRGHGPSAATVDGNVPGVDDSAESSEPCDEIARLRADALGLLCEAALGKGLGATERGEAWQIAVHVDAGVLARPNETGVGETDDGVILGAETCRRLACDAPQVTLLRDSRDGALHVGRKTRRISLPLWRALKERDRTCRFPGCNRTGRLAAHHIHPWAQGGETGPGNLVLLCRAHHWAVHEGGFTVERDAAGEIRFRRPDGRQLSAPAPAAHLDGIPLHGLRERLARAESVARIDPGEIHGHYEPMDYDLALTALFSLREAASDRSPGG